MGIKQLTIKLKKIVFNKWMLILYGMGVAFVLFSNIVIVQSTKKDIYSKVNETPQKNIGLILGTSRYTVRGTTNLYFKYRIEAAVKLYHAGKISHIIVSGDNSDKTYNEPRQMWDALLNRGIPNNAITLDYAGFRTLDSVVRSKEVFGQSEIIIISQRFHLERALFIASKYKMNAVGFSAKDPPKKYSLKTDVREYFAKTKAVIDLYIINKKPKFLGKREFVKI